VIRDECGRREANRFEPQAGKGPVARATLYFLLRYPNHVQPDGLPERSAVLLDLHDQFPPGDYERHRNAAVFARQPSPTSPPAPPATQANRRPYRSGPCLPIVFRGTAASGVPQLAVKAGVQGGHFTAAHLTNHLDRLSTGLLSHPGETS
jgi:hypothetical protein